jgi:hypothetical protein
VSDVTEETRTVTLGGVDVEVLPQPPAYLIKRAKALIATLTEPAGEDEAPAAFDLADLLFGEKGYQALSALIPDIPKKIPLHAWLGYPTEEAMQAGELDETRPPHPPTFPELKAAVRAFTEVNEYDVVERLLGMLDPQFGQDLAAALVEDLISMIGPTLQSLAAGSEPSTSSTETSPPPTANGSGSPSPVSTA